MANFKEIEGARKLLGLGEAATLKEIKTAYRTLAHRHHPDKHGEDNGAESATMKQLNRAYKLLMDYCDNYKYSFRGEDVAETDPHEEYLRTFREKWYDII